jgi:hypothetical protein
MVRLRARSRLFATVGLAALVFLQVSIASHQFEHVADDSTQYCRVCVQQDRLDDAVPVTTSVEVDPRPAVAATSDYTVPTLSRVASQFRARAPPSLS